MRTVLKVSTWLRELVQLHIMDSDPASASPTHALGIREEKFEGTAQIKP